MNEKDRIEYIKREWKKFLEKNSKRDIDISKIKSIDEVKQALKIREAVEYISEEFKVGLSDEQVVLLSDALIEKTVIDEKGEIKEISPNTIHDSVLQTKIIESNKSRIFDQAENRLHVQQALLAKIFSENNLI